MSTFFLTVKVDILISFFVRGEKNKKKYKANKQTKTHPPQISQDARNTFDKKEESFSTQRQKSISFFTRDSQAPLGEDGSGWQ